MATLKNYRTIKEGSKIFDAYFKSGVTAEATITKTAPFGTHSWDEEVQCVEASGKKYAILGYDHFNAHFSNFTDRSAIYGINIAEVAE